MMPNYLSLCIHIASLECIIQCGSGNKDFYFTFFYFTLHPHLQRLLPASTPPPPQYLGWGEATWLVSKSTFPLPFPPPTLLRPMVTRPCALRASRQPLPPSLPPHWCWVQGYTFFNGKQKGQSASKRFKLTISQGFFPFFTTISPGPNRHAWLEKI